MTKISKLTASIAATLIALSMAQTATAAERTTRHRSVPAMTEQVRNANASFAPFYTNQGDFARYENGGGSAPAGR